MDEPETEINYYISKEPQNQLDLDTIITILEGGYPVETVENILGNSYVIRSRANSVTWFIWFETTIGGIQNGQWEDDEPGDDNIPLFTWRINYLSEQETNDLFRNLGAIPTDYGFCYQNLFIQIEPDYYYPDHKREVYFISITYVNINT